MQRALSRTVALLEIVGALAGLALLYSFVWPRFGSLTQPVVLSFFFFVGLSLVAGVELWRGERRGWMFSVLVQALQLFSFGGQNWSFRLQAGPQLIWFAWGPEWLWYGFRSGLDVGPKPETATYFGVNLVALLALVVLLKLRGSFLQFHRSGLATERSAA